MPNPAWCAFLRGVNVNGRTLKMADVCAAVAAAGPTEVSSILASGNICFRAAGDAGVLRSDLETALTSAFELPITLFVVPAATIDLALETVPWPADPEYHRYVFFGEPGVVARLQDSWDACTPTAGEAAAAAGEVFFWRCAVGSTLTSAFSKVLGNKAFRTAATSRNITTVAKISQRLGQY